MKLIWYDTRYIKCPVCNDISHGFFNLKDVKGWALDHKMTCDATDFSMDGYVELV